MATFLIAKTVNYKRSDGILTYLNVNTLSDC